jgi:hypothetical protein
VSDEVRRMPEVYERTLEGLMSPWRTCRLDRNRAGLEVKKGANSITNPNLGESVQFYLHARCLVLHVLVFFSLWGISWFIPDGFYDFYMHASIYFSTVYIAIQIIRSSTSL